MLDGCSKGFPVDRRPLRLADLGNTRWGLFTGDLDTPVAVLKESAMEGNASWMKAFLETTGASICPHGKTTMAPQLFHRQLQDGAWGMTVANPQQARVALEYGVKRILIANEVVSDGAIEWLRQTLDADSSLDIIILVDSLDSVDRLAGHPGKRPLRLVLELGIPGGRCGARSHEKAMAVARAVKTAPGLKLCGVEAYEGIVTTADAEADLAIVDEWLSQVGDVAKKCCDEALFETEEVLLTAGGSAYFDRVAEKLGAVELGRQKRILLRSGCYYIHDSGHYDRLIARLESRLSEEVKVPGGLRPALEVWGRVLSRPEPGMAILDIGKRDVSHDVDLPKPVWWARPGEHVRPQIAGGAWHIACLYDQHAKLMLSEEADLKVGDLVGCTISHPCTTFDKWQMVYVVDDGYRVIEGVKTFF